MGLDRRGVLAAGLLLALGGCATRGAGGVSLVLRPGPEAGELETLSAVRADAAGLTLRVTSTGCTAKGDFAFYVGRETGGRTLAFARKRLDVCRAAPRVQDVRFSYEELGLTGGGSVRLLNAVKAGEGLSPSG